jgi:ferredoxin
VPKIEFLENPAGRAKSADVPEGGPLVDVCDEYLAPVPFSCRSATCATCQIEILEGADLLEPPGPEEAELLEVVGGPEGSRLACQAQIKPGSGTIRLRPV